MDLDVQVDEDGTEEQRISCPFCNTNINGKRNIIRHIRRIHKNEVDNLNLTFLKYLYVHVICFTESP